MKTGLRLGGREAGGGREEREGRGKEGKRESSPFSFFASCLFPADFWEIRQAFFDVSWIPSCSSSFSLSKCAQQQSRRSSRTRQPRAPSLDRSVASLVPRHIDSHSPLLPLTSQKSVSYSGTNHRLRRVLRRALNGESIRIGVLGGSSSSLPSASLLLLRS